MNAVADIDPVTGPLAPASLATVMELAELQTRVDRKYLIGPAVFARLTDELGDRFAVLEIDRLRAFRYESVYFDTPELDSYLSAAHERRRRFKVRTRTYLDSGGCVLEVKTRGGRGETVKQRMEYDVRWRDRLTSEAHDFVRECTGLVEPQRLAPTVTTSYRRTTLVDVVARTRLTCDNGLVCSTGDGRAVSLPDELLLETKSAGGPTTTDRFLWAGGHRPTSVSKYCLALAALDPTLPANKWHRTLGRYFGRV